ncbi:hypothetical protein HK097_008526 [Rhizophlyctis rosea]|uniref:polynucleotide adenylyltransferase n=1 Tax=Rhizophlyctis rosea TaxID=64517 RepID=A0AAD5SAC1_9FUNG|nr:hypothetical protein HK097_008526 [Rhizophlyctis rosea]
MMESTPKAAVSRSQKATLLHDEILQFTATNSLHNNESRFRQWIVTRVRKLVIAGLGPNSSLKCYGSSNTGLALPHSDIDLVIFAQRSISPDTPPLSPNGHSPDTINEMDRRRDISILRTIRGLLVQSTLPQPHSVEVISGAFVPVLKFSEKITRTRVDITVNKHGGKLSSEQVREWMKMYPQLRPLAVALKQYLFSKALNECYLGGIGGYLLVNMVVFFFKQQPHLTDNLGILLADFFKFYGSFEYERWGVCARTGQYINKGIDRRPWYHPPNARAFLCADACDYLRDLAKSSHAVPEIFKEWKQIHLHLHTLYITTNPCESILPTIVKISPEWVERRRFNIKLLVSELDVPILVRM